MNILIGLPILILCFFGVYKSVFSTRMNFSQRGYINLASVIGSLIASLIVFGQAGPLGWSAIGFIMFVLIAPTQCFVNCPNCNTQFSLWKKPPAKPVFYDPPALDIEWSFPLGVCTPYSYKCGGCGLPKHKLFRNAEKLKALKSEIDDFEVKKHYTF